MTSEAPFKAQRVISRESNSKQLIEQSRIRLLCAVLVFALSFGAIGVRLIEFSLVSNAPEETVFQRAIDASRQNALNGEWNAPTKLSRGDIVDRNGLVLATSLSTLSLFANPRVMIEPDEAAEKLAGVFPDMSEKELKKKLKQDASFVWIKRNSAPREQHAVNNLGIPGLYFLPESRRIYPHNGLLSHVLGYVGLDNKGLAGVEKQFDRRLNNTKLYTDPLKLSVDLRLQQMMHEELEHAINEFRALGGSGMLLDLNTQEMLAMVSMPDFNPNEPVRVNDPRTFNRATLGVYEMGSTFKTFTAAMALDYGTVTPQSGYDATEPLKVSRFTISDTHPKKRWLSVPEIYAYSSNIGTVKMYMDVGAKRQKAFLKKLGLLEAAAIELPEVGRPIVPKEWREINAMTISFGHGLSVSPLNLIRATAAVVNGGVLKPLTLVKDGNLHREDEMRIMKETTSRQMRGLMRMVVEFGTASKAEAPGYRVGGKTGTAEKVVGGGYNANAKQALFVGTFPVDNPRYLILVMVDEPKGNSETHGYATGGWIAAPVAGNVIKRMAPLYGIRPIFQDLPVPAADRDWINAANQKFLHEARY